MRPATLVLLLTALALIFVLFAVASARTARASGGAGHEVALFARSYRIASGANATVILGYVPCGSAATADLRDRAVTRLTADADLDRMRRIWERLSASPDAQRFVVPPLLNAAGDILSCGVAALDFTEIVSAATRRPFVLPPELTTATYFERAVGQTAFEALTHTADPIQTARLLFRCAEVLSFFHSQGVAHTDPHLGNFTVERPLPGTTTTRVRAIDWMDGVVQEDTAEQGSRREDPSNVSSRKVNKGSIDGAYVEASRFAPDAFMALADRPHALRHVQLLDVGMFGRSVINALHERAKLVPNGQALADAVEASLVALNPDVFGGYVDYTQNFIMGDTAVSRLDAHEKNAAVLRLPRTATALLSQALPPDVLASAACPLPATTPTPTPTAKRLFGE